MNIGNELSFRRRAVAMSVSKDFILESSTYKDLRKAGQGEHEAIMRCLEILGGDLSDVVLVQGLVRINNDKTKMYKGQIYNLFTTETFPYKHIYEDVTCLFPDEAPKGVELTSIYDIIYEEDEEDEDKPKTRSVRGRYKNSKINRELTEGV
jgi:hypothetical protein